MIEQKFSFVLSNGRRRLMYNNAPCHLSGPASHAILGGYPDVTAAQKVKMTDGYNYVRHWCYDYGLLLYANEPGRTEAQVKAARLRAYPYTYNAETKKWDVKTLNPAYKTWLKNQLAAAKTNGVVLLISLFSNQDFRIGEGFGWNVCPWKASNNLYPDLFNPPARPAGNTDSSYYWRQFIKQPTTTSGADYDRKIAIQQYITDMVNETSGYWNVFFEICNEPQATIPIAACNEYLAFCDMVAAQVHTASLGKRTLLYNPLPNGQDFTNWIANPALPNWNKVNGVVYHGIDPGTFNPNACTFRDKVFIQLSSDAYRVMDSSGKLLRDNRQKNMDWANRLAPLDVDFEAYTYAPGCKGVLDAAPANRPTKLV